MRFILYAAAAVIGLGLLILLIGLLLPATREGRAEVVIAAKPADILAVIRAVEAQPEWRDDVAVVTRSDEGWIETTKQGQQITFTPEVMSENIIRLRFASAQGFSGKWEAQMVAEGANTKLSVIEQVTVAAPIGRIISRLFINPNSFATTYVTALKQRVEGQ